MTGAATVDKALDLLFHLHDVRRPLGPSEIARGLGLPKSSCHRLLGSLLARELVERDAAGHYRPGLGLLVLGLGAQEREPVIRVARPILEAEATGFGETVFLVGPCPAGLVPPILSFHEAIPKPDDIDQVCRSRRT